MSLPKPYYEDEARGIVIYNADCREILPLLPKVDMVLTSPPYDNLREYGGHEIDVMSCVPIIAQAIVRGGVIMWNVADATINGSESGSSFKQALAFMDAGLNLHDTMIYCKEGFAFPEANRYHPAFEYMFVFSNGSPKTFHSIKDRKNKKRGIKLMEHNDSQTANLSLAQPRATYMQNLALVIIGGLSGMTQIITQNIPQRCLLTWQKTSL